MHVDEQDLSYMHPHRTRLCLIICLNLGFVHGSSISAQDVELGTIDL